MIETISLILFISAILFVALMAPKPSDKNTELSGRDPKPSDKGAEPADQEKKGPDSPGE